MTVPLRIKSHHLENVDLVVLKTIRESFTPISVGALQWLSPTCPGQALLGDLALTFFVCFFLYLLLFYVCLFVLIFTLGSSTPCHIILWMLLSFLFVFQLNACIWYVFIV